MRCWRAVLLVPLALTALDAGAAPPPRHTPRSSGSLPASGYDAYVDHARQSGGDVAASPLVAVTSRDAQRDVPTFAWARQPAAAPPPALQGDPAAAARYFLRSVAPLYRVSASDIAALAVVRVHDTGRGGIVVTLRPKVDGVEVWRSDTKVLLSRSLELEAIGGNPRAAGSARGRFVAHESEALAVAFGDMQSLAISPVDFVAERELAGGYLTFKLNSSAASAADLRLGAPARARRVWFALPEGLVPAYYLELFVGKIDVASSDAFAYVVAADDLRILYRQDLTQRDAFDYRVFADDFGEHRPLDGPIADFTPHPTGIPDQSYPAYAPPVLVSIDGFNTNPQQTFDSWLPSGATEATGNNADAYTDNAPDGFSSGDVRASTTGPNAFDRVYDVALDPIASDDQRMAAVTQLFYVVNWQHDWWYDSGFDEQAGNAQQDNYGRGGLGGDRMHAQAQDGALDGNSDNANMSTPADGMSPRMQMYLYTAPSEHSLTVQPLNMTLFSSSADFGPDTFDVTADVVLVDDQNGTVSDACEPIVNDVVGKIALIDRGQCSFESKVNTAESAGAAGVIIANNLPNSGPPPLGNSNDPSPGIGALGISLEDGDALKAALLNGAVSAHLFQFEGVRPDGTIDNMIVAHEWGHYLHHRLVTCSSKQCAGQSEGWGDFNALMTAIRPADDISGSYAAAIYAPQARLDPAYYGIRRAPYSVDMTKNGFTFRHIQQGETLPNGFPQQGTSQNNSEVHNSGEIWAAMLLEAYTNLIARSQGGTPAYSFEEARRRMGDYIVAGMQLAPVDPTFTEQRDALLAAAGARDLVDMLALADGFAKRGAGSCAVSPPRDSTDNVGVSESFEVAPTLHVEAVRLIEAETCDGDGLVDAGETATLEIDVTNTGPLTLDTGSIAISTASEGVAITAGSFDITALEPFALTTLTAEVTVDRAVAGPLAFAVDMAIEAPGTCEPSASRTDTFRIDFDNATAVSASDDFDGAPSVWTPDGSEPEVVWTLEEAAPLDVVWRGIDLGRISDTWIESPDVDVSDSEPLVLTLVHRHSFEVDPTTYWDGGVIEISRNFGFDWEDVVMYDDPGYGGPLSDEADNPLSDRMAFVATNPAWPETDTVSVDLADNFAGDRVRFRFRIGTDQAASDFGWAIHSVTLAGVLDTPFPSIIADAGVCAGGPPTADAGPDRTVEIADQVALDGSASSDPDGDALTFAWQQLDGPEVALDDAAAAAPRFEAPSVDEETTLRFELTVSDGSESATDEVTITVAVHDDKPFVVTTDGCGCKLAPARERAWPWLAALVSLLVARRRRREPS